MILELAMALSVLPLVPLFWWSQAGREPMRDACYWGYLGVLMVVWGTIFFLMLGLPGLVVAVPMWVIGQLMIMLALILFDQWRRGRRRSPGRLHGWRVRIIEGRLRLMPTPA